MIPIITLENGLKIANFSSPHPFNFTTGEVLPACSDERAKGLMLKVVEKEDAQDEWTDIEISFAVSDKVLYELEKCSTRWSKEEFDILLVPFPVLQAVKQAASENEVADFSLAWIRTIRCADPITKAIHPDRFCK